MDFGFTIIVLEDGTEIIDRNVTTPHEALTPLQMLEYEEVEVELFIFERERMRLRKEALARKKAMENPFYKFACMCGLI